MIKYRRGGRRRLHHFFYHTFYFANYCVTGKNQYRSCLDLQFDTWKWQSSFTAFNSVQLLLQRVWQCRQNFCIHRCGLGDSLCTRWANTSDAACLFKALLIQACRPSFCAEDCLNNPSFIHEQLLWSHLHICSLKALARCAGSEWAALAQWQERRWRCVAAF